MHRTTSPSSQVNLHLHSRRHGHMSRRRDLISHDSHVNPPFGQNVTSRYFGIRPPLARRLGIRVGRLRLHRRYDPPRAGVADEGSAVDAPLIADLHAPDLVEDAELRDRPHGEAPCEIWCEIKKRQTDKPSTSMFWWALQDLNLRPLPCQPKEYQIVYLHVCHYSQSTTRYCYPLIDI